jgi:structure-specific endonuclease subunit SLX1
VRRLDQHNGKILGGAVRTSRASLRPWEMVCIVSGFPSNIAALQMEWALTNPHLSRHIDNSKRISFAVTKIKTNARTGKTRRKPTRPSSSLLDKLSNLHILLRAPYFSQWPLEVRFFSEDVYRSWLSWCERVDEQLHPSIHVRLDLPQQTPTDPEQDDITSGQRPSKRRKADLIGRGGITGIDPSYAPMREVLEKGRFMQGEDDTTTCSICNSSLRLERDLFTICTGANCTSVSHVRCLSKHFLRSAPQNQVLPKSGQCPSCHEDLAWLDLMKDLSLRARGQVQISKILSKRRKPPLTTTAAAPSDDDSEQDSDVDMDDVLPVEDELDPGTLDEDDAQSVLSLGSDSSVSETALPSRTTSQRVEIVIEDSDDDLR